MSRILHAITFSLKFEVPPVLKYNRTSFKKTWILQIYVILIYETGFINVGS